MSRPALLIIKESKISQTTNSHSANFLLPVSNWLRRAIMMQDSRDVIELQPLQDDQIDLSKQGVTKNGSNMGKEYHSISPEEDEEATVMELEMDLDSSVVSKVFTSAVLAWTNVFFPPDLPHAVQLLRLENLALPACYLLVGCMQGMFRPLLNVYPLDLGATEAQQTTMASIATLPAAFKIVYGFWSDNIPIAGYRRKPYMMAGWLLASALAATLLMTCDLSMSNDSENHSVATPPTNAPSVQFLSIVFFLFGTSMWFADVMADSLVAQKARLEPEEYRGNLQSSCYACRFFGLMMAAPVSTLLYSSDNVVVGGATSIVTILMVGPLLLMPLVYFLQEDRHVPIKPTSDQCAEIWKTVCTRSVWQPLGFTFVFNLLQVSNAAWRQFLKSVLAFSSAQLNALLVGSYVLLYLGTMTYKVFFLHSSWRRLYQICILLNVLVSGLQLLLIRGHTFGLSPFWFALGDDSFSEFLQGMQFLPIAIMMVNLVPVGSEGASYAMYTTFWNSAMLLAPAISTMLLPIWDVSKATLERGELNGMFNLTLLTTVIQASPIFLLSWLPHGKEDLMALSLSTNENENPHATSRLGGVSFLIVLFGSMLYTFTVTILNLVAPGWAGET